MTKGDNSDISEERNIALDLSWEETQKLMKFLEEEGIMGAGFAIHESNNSSIGISTKKDR